MRLLWVILAIIGGGLVLLMLNNDSGSTFGIANDDFGNTLYLAVWGLVVAAALFGSRIPLGSLVRHLAIWLAIVLALIAGYQYRYELQDIASRVTAGLVPGSPLALTSQDGRPSVMLQMLPNGHFGARASVNGEPVMFVVDTGATTTVLTQADARRAGIETDRLTYGFPVLTANGMTEAAGARLDEISIGPIARRDFRVLVVEGGKLDQSLLGMNFLGTLSGYDVRGDRMILRD